MWIVGECQRRPAARGLIPGTRDCWRPTISTASILSSPRTPQHQELGHIHRGLPPIPPTHPQPEHNSTPAKIDNTGSIVTSLILRRTGPSVVPPRVRPEPACSGAAPRVGIPARNGALTMMISWVWTPSELFHKELRDDSLTMAADCGLDDRCPPTTRSASAGETSGGYVPQPSIAQSGRIVLASPMP